MQIPIKKKKKVFILVIVTMTRIHRYYIIDI